MSEEQKQIEVFETRRFTKALGKLAESQLVIVEDEIENIIENPELGELKKGTIKKWRWSFVFGIPFYPTRNWRCRYGHRRFH